MSYKILIPTDGLKSSYLELEMAEKILAEDDEIIILSVANKISPHHFQRKSEIEAMNKLFVEEAEDNVKHMADSVTTNHKVTTKVVVDSSVADAIVKVADEEEVDLIIIARSNKTGINKYILGSVTEKVTQKADVDILLIQH